MPHEAITIVDEGRNVVATGLVEFLGDCYSGSVNVDRMSDSFQKMFVEYEDVVNNQTFSILDQIEDRISSIRFSAIFEGGSEFPVKDLQIFPKGGTLSFKA
ncbi:hypothetical protein V5E97_18205 [Singulisphaera sp. Ch08]|uniref:Uncharacterized protein n=1 Tax=Singulisphaera sp. Ch08 TaxID=3120278 RepID=A0AAU7CSE1_9BACT